MFALVRTLSVIVALVATPAFADGAFVPRGQIDFTKLLPPPPEEGSEAAKADVAAVLDAQSKRTAETSARAVADNEITVFRFADVVGPDFIAAKLPVTAAFFEKLKQDSHEVIEPAKKFWNRPRPEVADASIKPLLPLPRNAAYPSGHTSWARLNAIVLAEMLPEKRAQIFSRADEYANNRIVAGVHFPTDVASGKIAGSLIASAEFQNPAFREAFAKARAELRAALGFAQATQ